MNMPAAIRTVTTHFSVISVLFLAICTYGTHALSANEFTAHTHWEPVAESALAELRAGFVLGNGVVVDLNFQKSIFRNGELASYSYFQTPQDFALLSKDQFSLQSILPTNSLNTVLQNTLDNQTLLAITNIDITIKNLEHAKQAFSQEQLYNTYFNAIAHQ
jgi:hypothetical protein